MEKARVGLLDMPAAPVKRSRCAPRDPNRKKQKRAGTARFQNPTCDAAAP
jgi:hypothetical protein